MKVIIDHVKVDGEYREMKVSTLIEAIQARFEGVMYIKNTPDDYDNFHTSFSFKEFIKPKTVVYEYQWYRVKPNGQIQPIEDSKGFYFTQDEVTSDCIKIEDTKRIRNSYGV